MANQVHVELLKGGRDHWNQWRLDNPGTQPDLRGTDLSNHDLRGFALRRVLLSSILHPSSAVPGMIRLGHVRLGFAGSIITDLSGSDLRDTLLNGADLTDADLRYTSLVNTDFTGASLSRCRIYGIAAWNVRLDGAMQHDLVITPDGEPRITTDNLHVAQFLYLLLKDQTIRHLIDAITTRVVLILGRFTPDRKVVLDAIRDELRKRDYLPVLFDFEKPATRDVTETVSTLAHMARFVIADITDAKSIPQELMKIVPALPSVPVRPILLASEHEWGMFRDLVRYPWVLEPYLYTNQASLLAAIESQVIAPAEAKAKEQTGR